DIPTAKELGYDVSIGTWRGYGVPLGTPKEIVDYLEKTLIDAAKSPAFVKFMNDTQNDIDLYTSAEYAVKLKEDDEQFKKLIIDLGLDQ
ncbi:MAG: tripartite tricarboxylate transporter substrate binding protein, partial [Planctomycetes bacterium]|nr:tripartite tricarboxylate transporter substrate binding protein [Planctomycetota bacterium]